MPDESPLEALKRIGPAPPARSDVIEPPAVVARRIRDRLLDVLDKLATGAPIDWDPAALAELARTAKDLDAIAASAPRTPEPPPFDPGELAVKLWNELQEKGHPTSVSDDAVDALRDLLGKPA